MKKALIGAGGFADEVKAHMGQFDMVSFVDDSYYKENDNNIKPLSEFNPAEYEVLIAIGDPTSREQIVNRLPNETKYFSFIHPTALIMGDVEIGEGSFIGAYSILTTNIKLGSHSLLNRANHIGHDCVIGDYFSAMPGSIVSGNALIGDRVYLGTNSSIREKLKITNDVTIGLNTGVVKSIAESGIYVGQNIRTI